MEIEWAEHKQSSGASPFVEESRQHKVFLEGLRIMRNAVLQSTLKCIGLGWPYGRMAIMRMDKTEFRQATTYVSGG